MARASRIQFSVASLAVFSLVAQGCSVNVERNLQEIIEANEKIAGSLEEADDPAAVELWAEAVAAAESEDLDGLDEVQDEATETIDGMAIPEDVPDTYSSCQALAEQARDEQTSGEQGRYAELGDVAEDCAKEIENDPPDRSGGASNSDKQFAKFLRMVAIILLVAGQPEAAALAWRAANKYEGKGGSGADAAGGTGEIDGAADTDATAPRTDGSADPEAVNEAKAKLGLRESDIAAGDQTGDILVATPEGQNQVQFINARNGEILDAFVISKTRVWMDDDTTLPRLSINVTVESHDGVFRVAGYRFVARNGKEYQLARRVGEDLGEPTIVER